MTCIAVGLAARAGELDLSIGLLGCYIGIFLGDLGLYIMGSLVRAGLVRVKRIARLLPHDRIDQLADRFAREGWKLIVLARFVPGMRWPVYVGAGVIGGGASRLVVFALIAGAFWTPLLVMLSFYIGEPIYEWMEVVAGSGWLSLLFAILFVYLVLRLLILSLTREGRATLAIKWERATRIEFWPPVIFYLPLVPLFAFLVVRYRGFESTCATNPGIRDGGFIGESKVDILDRLPARWIPPYYILRKNGDAEERTSELLRHIKKKRWKYPLILKPDAGQRGVGLKLVRNAKEVGDYVAAHPLDLLAQCYHPGPYEAGIFYVREPDQKQGYIFSITDKVFAVIEGDGSHSIEELIKRHPRYRLQQSTFLKRHAHQLDRVLKTGETLRLAIAGNHVQGTMFLDGAHLITPELTRTIDSIAKQFPGFYFGRFDVRYTDPEKFKAGKDLAIIELNGATAESTNIYDPRFSVWKIYGTLYRQWTLAFRIGYTNRLRGFPVTPLWPLLYEIIVYLRQRTRSIVAD